MPQTISYVHVTFHPDNVVVIRASDLDPPTQRTLQEVHAFVLVGGNLIYRPNYIEEFEANMGAAFMCIARRTTKHVRFEIDNTDLIFDQSQIPRGRWPRPRIQPPVDPLH